LIRETCRRVLVLDQGRLVADGPTRDVLADAALMEAHGLEVPHSLSHHHADDQHHGI
jgi:cobalt/nickel transport system ATP-binding protein